MTGLRTLLVIAFAVVAPLCAFAGNVDTTSTPMDAEQAFEAMKTLEGTWTGEALVVPAGKSKEEGVTSQTSVTYEVIANGTSLVATYAKGKPMEMVSLFHLDGPSEFVHTHYCAVGNQPSMRFEKSEKPGEIIFMFSKGSNMDVDKDGHVHNSRVRFIDDDTVESETDLWRDGQLSAVRHTKMKRQK